ncbi:MAG: hypothetical protein QM689_09440 [Oscillospiraceae bacterium]
MDGTFRLIPGVEADTAGICAGFSRTDTNNLLIQLGADERGRVVTALFNKLKAPLFFIAELPCTEQEEAGLRKNDETAFHYHVYYLDGCTHDTAAQLLRRYGDLLFSDGLIRFGFGSHADNAEVFCVKYQLTRIYAADTAPFEAVLTKNSIPQCGELKTLWDTFTADTPGTCAAVEIDGEDIFTMVEELCEVGLYLSHTAEE